jgi:hypothetical protein
MVTDNVFSKLSGPSGSFKRLCRDYSNAFSASIYPCVERLRVAKRDLAFKVYRSVPTVMSAYLLEIPMAIAAAA